jgi:hypothetical protein
MGSENVVICGWCSHREMIFLVADNIHHLIPFSNHVQDRAFAGDFDHIPDNEVEDEDEDEDRQFKRGASVGSCSLRGISHVISKISQRSLPRSISRSYTATTATTTTTIPQELN